jgi:hypothetical protein
MSTYSRTWGILVTGLALVGFSVMGACISDSDDPGAEETGGTPGVGGAEGGADPGSSGGEGNSSSGGSPSSGRCATTVTLDSPLLTDFEDYDGVTPLQEDANTTWSFTLGGTGIDAGTFGYGDEPDGTAEAFEAVDGHDSTYAMSISDSLAGDTPEGFGGGMGLWLGRCLDLTEFSGLSFWVRGEAPTGTAKVSLFMSDTTTVSNDGQCDGSDSTCVHPEYEFDVTDEWTEVRLAWSDFDPGNAAGTTVVPDGSNVWQIQFDIGVEWSADSEPIPAAYELVVDDLTLF